MSEHQNFDTNYFRVLTRFKERTTTISTVSMENVVQCGAFFRPMFFNDVVKEVRVAEQWSIVDGRFFVISSRPLSDEDSIFREKSLGLCSGFVHI